MNNTSNTFAVITLHITEVITFALHALEIS